MTGRFITDLGYELSRAAEHLQTGAVSQVDMAALRERIGPKDLRDRLTPQELAAVLVELRRPGLVACALAELLSHQQHG